MFSMSSLRARPRALTALIALAIIGAASAAQAAGGAFAVDDSEIGKPGDCKVESWASFADNRDRAAVASPACVVNFGIPVELGGQISRARSDGVWSTAAGPKAKINILPVTPDGFGIGLAGATTWDAGTGRHLGGLINLPVTFQAHETFRINVNAGWSHDAVARLNYLSWGAGFEWELMAPLTLIGEVYGLAGRRMAQETDPRAQLGLRITPVKTFDIDVIYGRNITGVDAHWLTLGLNLRF
jgi:hypothetical protein